MRYIRSLCNKILSALKVLWHDGIGDLIHGKKLRKGLCDGLLSSGWFILLTKCYSNAHVSIVGITFIMAILTRTLCVDGGSIAGELINAFIVIILYAISAGIFWWCLESALIAGIFLIPNVTKEIYDAYHRYHIGLTL